MIDRCLSRRARGRPGSARSARSSTSRARARGASARSSSAIRVASTLPSSTPHWSNGLMSQIDALREDAVLVEGDELAERRGGRAGRPAACSSAGCPRTRGAGTSQSAVPSARTSLGGLAERERLGLREHVGHQQVVVLADRVERVREADEVARDQARALVDQLVEGVLPVGARLAPVDRPRLVVDAARPASVTDLPLDSMVSCWR